MTFNYGGVDPTENYESRQEIQADTEYEERKLDETEQKVFEYMNQYAPVNRDEIYGLAQKGCAYALGEDPDEYQISIGEILVSEEFAEEYIKRNNIQFDEEGDIIDNPF